MSDTITITAEEREMWASTATARINAVTPERQCEITAQERLVKALKALEQAEARAKESSEALTASYMSGRYDGRKEAETRADELETYISNIVCELTDGRLSEPYDISVITDEVEAIYRAHTEEAVVKATEKAEAENARLTKMVDWLAGALAEDGCPYLAYWADFGGDMRPDWCICTDTPDDGFDCTGDPKACWEKEAARRAVADSNSVKER